MVHPGYTYLRREVTLRRVVPLLSKKQGVMRRREVSFLPVINVVTRRRVVPVLGPSLGETGSNEAQSAPCSPC